ncbi:hypothetical protein MHBO_000781 [Bonamia ostreae]|uniref:Uncharacterized protein n=1 Tax=Bonamia ostreae TaxID=126728 RepID=A0ABV2AGT7_9EUKA
MISSRLYLARIRKKYDTRKITENFVQLVENTLTSKKQVLTQHLQTKLDKQTETAFRKIKNNLNRLDKALLKQMGGKNSKHKIGATSVETRHPSKLNKLSKNDKTAQTNNSNIIKPKPSIELLKTAKMVLPKRNLRMNLRSRKKISANKSDKEIGKVDKLSEKIATKRKNENECDIKIKKMRIVKAKNCTNLSNNATNSSIRRVRHTWSDLETESLVEGVKKHGAGSWSEIKSDETLTFSPRRTNVDLKDKWKNMVKSGKFQEYE